MCTAVSQLRSDQLVPLHHHAHFMYPACLFFLYKAQLSQNRQLTGAATPCSYRPYRLRDKTSGKVWKGKVWYGKVCIWCGEVLRLWEDGQPLLDCCLLQEAGNHCSMMQLAGMIISTLICGQRYCIARVLVRRAESCFLGYSTST
jgi:hypothetical protein